MDQDGGSSSLEGEDEIPTLEALILRTVKEGKKSMGNERCLR